MNLPDETPLDERLRAAYDFMAAPPTSVPPPPARIWAGIEAGLQPRPSGWVKAGRPALTGMGGLLVGALLTYWMLLPTAVPERGAPEMVAALRSPAAAVAPGMASGQEKPAGPAASQPVAERAAGRPALVAPALTHAGAGTARAERRRVDHTVALPVEALTPRVAALVVAAGPDQPAQPALSLPAALVPLARAEASVGELAHDSSWAARARVRAALLAERVELDRLRRRADSLLLALGEPVAPPAGVAESEARGDARAAAAPRSRWSVLLAFAPERNFFGLQAPAGDTLAALRRTHEQGRGGYNAALLAEYRLTNQLSIAGGAGLSTYGAELRLTDRHTTITTRMDTSETVNVRFTQVITRAYSIRVVQDTVMSPIFNLNNQIIGYEPVLVPRRDTVWTINTVAGYDTLRTRTYTPVITRREEVSARILRPNYRFLTLPVLVRYRLGNPDAVGTRWWTDVAVGAQLQFFLGGTQLTTPDGRSYETRRVGVNGGPFRPVNVALQGAVAVNYALTPRLSASVAPTLRWQVQSVYKPSTGLTQRPTATGVQLGLRLAF